MNRMKKILADLAINIHHSIDEDWQKAVLHIEVLNKYSSYKGQYYKSSRCLGHSISVSKFDPTVDMNLSELHKLTQSRELNHTDWNRAIFTLFPDNKFEIEYIWDQELQDEVDRYNREAGEDV